MVESFRLAESPPASGRIGKEPTDRPTKVVEMTCSPGTQLVENTSQESESTVPHIQEHSAVEHGNESAPVEIPDVQS